MFIIINEKKEFYSNATYSGFTTDFTKADFFDTMGDAIAECTKKNLGNSVKIEKICG